jgi:hypothetical protein
MPVALADEQGREEQADDHEGHAQVERLRPDAPLRRHEARRQRGQSQGEVTRELVQAHGETAALRADQVDLHDDGRRPCEALARAEQHVGEEHPVPGRRPHQQEGYGHGHQPARHQHRLASDAVGEPAREVVREGLHDPEDHDEGEDRGAGREVELPLRHRGQDAALEPHHGAHERVDDDQQ